MKIVFLILVLSISIAAQLPTITRTPPKLEKPPPEQAPPCPLVLAEAPSWGGIKLGMTETAFQKIFPKMPFMVNKIDMPDDPAFDKLDSMMFTFYKERLEEVTIQFDPSQHWDNVGQFTDDLSETLKLPRLWTSSVGTGILECKEFRVRAVSSRNEIKLRDTFGAKAMQAENAPPPTKDTTQRPRPTRPPF